LSLRLMNTLLTRDWNALSVRMLVDDLGQKNSVAYSLHARIVEPQKPRNTIHYVTINEAVFSPCRAETHRACC
jgi:hypothetical protein